MALILPEAPSTLDEALVLYDRAGLRPILVHAPKGDGHKCSCGKEHEVNKHGTSACGKHPVASAWQKPADLEELRNQRARLGFQPNVGIVLGEQQRGEYIIAIDVDDEARFLELLADIGPLPPTVQGDSGRGRRLLFEYPKDLPVSKLKNITGLTVSKEEEKHGVDVKVRGGQVVVAPSIHVSGKSYTWTQLGEIALLPMAWALEIAPDEHVVPGWIAQFTPQSMRDDAKAKKRAEAYLQRAVMKDTSIIAGCGPGLRNTLLHKRAVALFSLCAGLYLGWRWEYVHDELRRAAMHSGLHKAEIERTLSSAERYVRETGQVRVPVGLADPPTAKVSAVPPPQGPPVDGGGLGAGSASPPQGPSDLRMTIHLSVEIHLDADASITALRDDPNLYQREGSLVHIVRTTPEEEKEGDKDLPKRMHGEGFVAGSPQIRIVTLPTLRERMTRSARYAKFTQSSGWVRVVPTDHLVAAVHARGSWKGIRPVIGIAETPFLRPDGTVCQTPGFDVATSYEHIPNDTFPVIPEKPTQADAIRAREAFVDLFYDFPYTLGATVPLAAILTLLARPAIQGATPLFAFDASTRGSGKSLQTDVIAMVATGRLMPRVSYPTLEEEIEKVLGAYAMRGAPFFSFDNVARAFGGPAIDRVLTARDTVEFRILGKSEVPTLPWRSVMFTNGNNLRYFGDTTRRVVRARIEPQEERPEYRSEFRHQLPAWARIERTNLVAAGLTILRAYTAAGWPDMGCPRWGGFEEWSRLIAHAIVFAGGQDPMQSRPSSDTEIDAHSAALQCLLIEVEKLFGNDEWRTSGLIDMLFRSERKASTGDTKEDGQEDLREAITVLCEPKPGQIPDPAQLGRKLHAARGRVMAGRKLESKAGRAGILRWFIVPVD